MITFPYYSGNIKNPYAKGYISLEEFIKLHKEPTVYLEVMKAIDKARSDGDEKLKNTLKQKLMAFTPSVKIDTGFARKYKNIMSFTGLMQIDLDKIPTQQEAVDLKEHIFHTHDEIVCAYLSPSKRGVKALMRIKTPSMIGGVYSREYAIKKFKAMHKAVEKEFDKYGYFDSATKNSILPLFLSHDVDLLSRDLKDVKVWGTEDWSKENYENLNTNTTFKYSENINRSKAVDLVVNAINNITDNGHPQVRSASLILGSRVGAGYISQGEAEQLIEHLIRSNSYLQKGIANYIKTSKWGIMNGMNNPKYY
jgi:hypothetical protein